MGVLEVGQDTLELVVKSLNYSSMDSFNEDVRKIKEWMMKQPHFSEIMVDKKIQNFLILNKGSVERSKEKIENYYSVRTWLPDVFEDINPKLPYMEHTLKATYFIPLPKLTKELYRVYFHKLRDASLTENFDFNYGLRLLVNIQELRLIEDVTYGDIVILDGQNTPPKLILMMNPMTIYNLAVVLYKKVFSNRLKAVYIMNAPSSVQTALLVAKKILKPKIFNRIHICENWDFLIEQIGEDVLPSDCGGKEKSLEELQERLREKFKEHRDYYDQLDTLRIVEELRPQRLKVDEMFGLSGNFKSLEID